MEVQSYQPGQFFRRELPCLLAVLPELPPVAVVVVDGYVWLDGVSVAGLGARLYQALAGKVAVIGVAKTRFAGAGAAVEVVRGRSTRPMRDSRCWTKGAEPHGRPVLVCRRIAATASSSSSRR